MLVLDMQAYANHRINGVWLNMGHLKRLTLWIMMVTYQRHPKTSYSTVNLRGNDSFWDHSTYQRRHVILTTSTPNDSACWYVTSLSWTLVSNHFNQSRVAFTNWLVHSLLRALSLPKSANSTIVEFSTYTSIFHGHLVVDFSSYCSCFLWQLSRTSCGFTNLQFHQAKLLPTWLRCAYPSGPGTPVRGPPVAAQKLRGVPWWFWTRLQSCC